MRASGYSRLFYPDTEFSALASEALGKAERAMHEARAAVLRMSGLRFRYREGQTVTTNHIVRDGASAALCGQGGAEHIGSPGMKECRECNRRAGRIVGVWVEGAFHDIPDRPRRARPAT